MSFGIGWASNCVSFVIENDISESDNRRLPNWFDRLSKFEKNQYRSSVGLSSYTNPLNIGGYLISGSVTRRSVR